MNMTQLMEGQSLPEDLKAEINQFIEAKKHSTEADLTKRNSLIDDFLSNLLKEETAKPEKQSTSVQDIQKANQLFQKIIKNN